MKVLPLLRYLAMQVGLQLPSARQERARLEREPVGRVVGRWKELTEPELLPGSGHGRRGGLRAYYWRQAML